MINMPFYSYFHHAGGIGFYYKENKVTDEILRITGTEYKIL